MRAERIAGLDLSVTRSGYAAPDGSVHSIVPRTKAAEPAKRLDEIERALVRLFVVHPPRPDYVVIEGYSLGTKLQRSSVMITLAELGGVVRAMLWRLGIEYVEVPPKNLKRFATGNGNADKALMERAARRHHAAITNDDEADAFHLRRMGLMAHGHILHEEQHELDAISASGVTW